MWEVLGPWYTNSAHIKDVVADPELVVHISEAPPGEGMLDLDIFFDVCSRLGNDAAVIVEHLPADRARTAIAYVRQAASERGITFD
jgi:sugar phosphate isomerase/epimerase